MCCAWIIPKASPPALVCGKIVFHETCPWCQKGRGPVLWDVAGWPNLPALALALWGPDLNLANHVNTGALSPSCSTPVSPSVKGMTVMRIKWFQCLPINGEIMVTQKSMPDYRNTNSPRALRMPQEHTWTPLVFRPIQEVGVASQAPDWTENEQP